MIVGPCVEMLMLLSDFDYFDGNTEEYYKSQRNRSPCGDPRFSQLGGILV